MPSPDPTLKQRLRRRARRPDRPARLPRQGPGGSPIDLRGRTFEALSVVRLMPRKPGATHRYWLCRCSCGRTHQVRSSHLVGGVIRCCPACVKASGGR
jgi:hypothetical protein